MPSSQKDDGIVLATMVGKWSHYIRPLGRLVWQGSLAAIQRSMQALRLKRLLGLRVLKLDRAVVQHFFNPSSPFSNETWLKANAHTGTTEQVTFPQDRLLGYSMFESSLVSANPRYSAIIRGSTFVLAPGAKGVPTRLITSQPPVSGLLRAEGETLLVRARVTSKTRGAIFAGSLSPHNWYHWLIDFLPALYLARQLPPDFEKFPLLVPQAALNKAHWREILEKILCGRDLLPFGPDSYAKVQQLVWVHGPTVRFPSSMLSSPGELAIEKCTLNDFRRFVLEGFQIEFSSNQTGTRIFLDRPGNAHRPYNQEEIIEIAGEYGFVRLASETITLRESISALLHAEYIVGPHGAGWANALFAERARAGLIWTWDEAMTENWFHNILAVRGIRAKTISTGSGSNATGYHLDGRLFRQALEEILR